MPAGRPSKYNPDFVRQGRRLCLLGANDADIAAFFEIDVATLYRWKLAHDEFREALKLSKAEADEAVESSLYRRALGYSQDATKIFQYEGVPVVVPYVENVAPDTTAMIFWLKNRQPDKWRNERIELTGKDGGPIEMITGVANELRAKLDRFAIAAATARTEGEPD